MLKIFNMYFEKDSDTYIDKYLCLRMKDLVALRQRAIDDKYIYKYEQKYVLDGMKNANEELAQIDPTPECIYMQRLENIASICKVMEYKTICFYRHENKMVDYNWQQIKEIIKREIAYNPYISYREIVNKDLSLDIETELEHLIESEQLIIRENSKNGRLKWKKII